MQVKGPVSVVISTRKRDEEFIQRTKVRFGHPNTEMLVYENDGSSSLASLYNRGLKESTNPVAVFMHDDVEIETPDVTRKLLKLFNNNPLHGIIGLAGTNHLIDAAWWRRLGSLFGQVKLLKDGELRDLNFSPPLGDRLKNVVCIDGLFIAVHKMRVKKPFDEEFRGFHFYDIPFCVQNHIEGVGIGVTTQIMVIHKSTGDITEDWHQESRLFMSKYGHLLPLQKA